MAIDKTPNPREANERNAAACGARAGQPAAWERANLAAEIERDDRRRLPRPELDLYS